MTRRRHRRGVLHERKLIGARVAKREYEAADIAAMLRRMLRSLVKRATAGELEAVEEIAALERSIGTYLADAARGAHDGPGAYSWTEIGTWLGMSRQAARERFSVVPAAAESTPTDVT